MDDKPIDECLHCAISEAVVAWVEEYAESNTGCPSIQITDALAALAQVMSDIISTLNKPERRAIALRIAHRSLDDCMATHATRNRLVS